MLGMYRCSIYHRALLFLFISRPCFSFYREGERTIIVYQRSFLFSFRTQKWDLRHRQFAAKQRETEREEKKRSMSRVRSRLTCLELQELFAVACHVVGVGVADLVVDVVAVTVVVGAISTSAPLFRQR